MSTPPPGSPWNAGGPPMAVPPPGGPGAVLPRDPRRFGPIVIAAFVLGELALFVAIASYLVPSLAWGALILGLGGLIVAVVAIARATARKLTPPDQPPASVTLTPWGEDPAAESMRGLVPVIVGAISSVAALAIAVISVIGQASATPQPVATLGAPTVTTSPATSITRPPSATSTTPSAPVTTERDSAPAPPDAKATHAPNPVPMGTAIPLVQNKTGLELTVTAHLIDTAAAPSIPSMKAAPGYTYVSANVTIANHGPGSFKPASAFAAFRLFTKDGKAYRASLLRPAKGPALDQYPEITEGSTVSGWVLFEIPAASPPTSLVYYGAGEWRV